MLNLMYITDNPEVAKIAEDAGVNRIFVDMEYIGKTDRQGGMDTVQSHHTLEDVKVISNIINKAELLVRINPIHDATEKYCSTEEEINGAIENGAQVLMLPYFKTVDEVEKFVNLVNGRVKTMPLVETPEAVSVIDDVLKIDGIDEIYIGLNDLSLGYGKKFMFELLCDGTVEGLACKFREKDIPFGFGGIAALGKGMLPSENVITEHYRLGSTRAILSRSFCNANIITDINKINSMFMYGLREIRDFEKVVEVNSELFADNYKQVRAAVSMICNS